MSKKIILTLWFAFITVSALHAQDAGDVRYDNVQVVRKGAQVEVSFKAFVGSNCIGRKGHFLFTPVLYNDRHVLSLPTFCVYSRHAEWMEFREDLTKKQAAHNKQQHISTYHSGNNGRISYSTTIDWQEELTDVALRVEPMLQSSRKKRYDFPAIRITNKLFLLSAAPVIEAPQEETVKEKVLKEETPKFDSIAVRYPFLVPLSGLKQEHLFDPDMPLHIGKGTTGSGQHGVEQFIATNEKGALYIHFMRNSSTLERHYKENNTALVTLASVLREIETSGNARIARIVIAGFSCVDGTLADNDRLAWERADAVREFIATNTSVPFGRIFLYNGSEDWRGLRRLVEQSAEMESRYDVLRIIDTVPILGGREKRLMELAGGIPYRYMKRYLFPKLRNAAFVKVYYTAHPTSSPFVE